MVAAAADLATTFTADFLSAWLGPKPRRVLEVGGGDGAVAALLGKRGHAVTLLDADPANIAAARARGVDARCAIWPDFTGDGFDAVAFTRSLHHVLPLDAAVQRAAGALRPDGTLLIEDFAYDEIDARTLQWLTTSLRDLDRNGLLRDEPGALASRLLRAGDPAALWQQEHDRDLHAFPAIAMAVAQRLRPIERSDVPYLFRYVAPVLAPGTGDAALRKLFADEQQRGRRGDLRLVGRRLVARREVTRASPHDAAPRAGR